MLSMNKGEQTQVSITAMLGAGHGLQVMQWSWYWRSWE